MFDLSGRRALITGAGQNVGAGIARALANQGARVVINDLIADRAEIVASEIGGGASAAPFDVTDLQAVIAAVEDHGPFDIVINNAGVPDGMSLTQFRDLPPESWDAAIRLNIYGTLNVTKAVIDGMCERRWGRVITIASVAGTAGVRIGVSPYATAKGGSIAFTRTLALEVARLGVTANSLALGLMTRTDGNIDAVMARSIPVGRVGTPDDVGAACVWLASDEGAWVTGQTIEINGGATTT